MNQEYIFNENAAIYNCNICGDTQLVMTGDGEQPPERCVNPMCESNEEKTPFPGMHLAWIQYPEPEKKTGLKCEGWEGPCNNKDAIRYHMRTQYAKTELNYRNLCPSCRKKSDEYWNEMWKEE